MSLDAIKKVAQAEEQARIILEEASAAARKQISDAEANARVFVNEAMNDAQQQVLKMLDDAEQEASGEILGLMRKNDEECEALRAHAEKNLEKAAALIMERIVIG